MPPPRGTPNPIEGPGDYDVTPTIRSDTYPAISPLKADYTSRAVFIAGASKGIGRAITLAYASAGASFIAAGARSDLTSLATDVLAAASAANRPAPQFLPLNVDVTDAAAVDEAAAAVIEAFGRIDVVVNVAGVITSHALIGDSDPEAWWTDMTVNLRGPYHVARSFIPHLLRTSTAPFLALVASVGAWCHSPTLTGYQTAKLGVVKLAEHIDAEYAAGGLTAFSVHPGNVPTDIVAGGISAELEKVFVDTPAIAADTLVWLTREKRGWLGGRYVNVTWDMEELEARGEEILKGNKLRLKLDF